MKVIAVALLFIVSTFTTTHSYAGPITSGGGDFVRGEFISRSHWIAGTLHTREDGRRFIRDHSLDFQRILEKAKTEFIRLSALPLYDENGSPVDSKVEDGILILDWSRWQSIVEDKSDGVNRLIVHELLRLSDIDDHNYKISKHMPPLGLPDGIFDRVEVGGRLTCQGEISVKDGNEITIIRPEELKSTCAFRDTSARSFSSQLLRGLPFNNDQAKEEDPGIYLEATCGSIPPHSDPLTLPAYELKIETGSFNSVSYTTSFRTETSARENVSGPLEGAGFYSYDPSHILHFGVDTNGDDGINTGDVYCDGSGKYCSPIYTYNGINGYPNSVGINVYCTYLGPQ